MKENLFFKMNRSTGYRQIVFHEFQQQYNFYKIEPLSRLLLLNAGGVWFTW